MGAPGPATATVSYADGSTGSIGYINPTPAPAPITQAEQDSKGEWLDTVLPPGPDGEWGGYPTGSTSSYSEPAPTATYSPPPPPPPPAPILPSFTRFIDGRYQVLVSPRDTVVFDDDTLPIDTIQELLYEELGGVELANMSRTDLIDGQEVNYTAIANLSQINRMYNPNNIVSSSTGTQFFSRFNIDLLSRGIHIPEFDDDGNIIIRIDEVNDGEVIEYQIALNGTIDRVDEA